MLNRTMFRIPPLMPLLIDYGLHIQRIYLLLINKMVVVIVKDVED